MASSRSSTMVQYIDVEVAPCNTICCHRWLISTKCLVMLHCYSVNTCTGDLNTHLQIGHGFHGGVSNEDSLIFLRITITKLSMLNQE